MKTPETIVRELGKRLESTWHLEITGVETTYPRTISLGPVSAEALRSDYSSIFEQTRAWHDWARTHDAELTSANRKARGGTIQQVPTHVGITSFDHAARIVGGWEERLRHARQRHEVLLARGLAGEGLARTLRLLSTYSGLDFRIALDVADWFLADPERSRLSVTPRQVPIPGVHAKWIQTHTKGILALTGLDQLGLLPAHPSRVHLTYLDPAHRAAGGRRFDMATVGDAMTPDYEPSFVLICENKDTVVHFPEVPGGIAVEGAGNGARTPAGIPWIHDAERLVYWGDLDAEGFEILAGYRRDLGRDIDALLMDRATYDAYERFGTDHDVRGKPLTARATRNVPELRAAERELYEQLLAEQTTTHRRLEQERIPLEHARAALRELLFNSH